VPLRTILHQAQPNRVDAYQSSCAQSARIVG
jgi:hypothetical protein